MGSKYKDGCEGCEISKNEDEKVKERGGIIPLPGDWVLNHYGGEEGFLGWLILQPDRHFLDFGCMNEDEASALGPNMKKIQEALRDY